MRSRNSKAWKLTGKSLIGEMDLWKQWPDAVPTVMAEHLEAVARDKPINEPWTYVSNHARSRAAPAQRQRPGQAETGPKRAEW